MNFENNNATPPEGTPETQPVVQEITPPVVESTEQKKPRKLLTKHFFAASARGKLNALWRFWLKGRKDKIDEYLALVRAGTQKIEGPLTSKDITKYVTMGFTISEDMPKIPRKPREKKQTVPPAAEASSPAAAPPTTAPVTPDNTPQA